MGQAYARRMNNLTGKTGTAFSEGEQIATFELFDGRRIVMMERRFGEPPRPSHQTGAVAIRFTDIANSKRGLELKASLDKHRGRRERCPAFPIDLKLDDGTNITGCSVDSIWDGADRFTLSLPDE